MKKKNESDLPPFVVLDKDGRWYVRRSYATEDFYPNGRRIYAQPKIRCFPETAERAAELALEIENEYNAVRSLKNGSITTFGELCDRFLETKYHTVAPNTYCYYKNIIQKHLLTPPTLAELSFAHITTFEIQNFFNAKQGTSSPKMIKKINTVLSMIFQQSIKWNFTTSNPTIGVDIAKVADPEVVWMELEDVKKFLSVCRTDPSFFILEFALETGMRPQEYLVLRWQDIDLAKGIVNVQRALGGSLPGKPASIKSTKTSSGRRLIKMSQTLVEKMKNHKANIEAKIANMNILANRPPLSSHMKKKGVNFRLRQARINNLKKVIEMHEKQDLVFPNRRGSHFAVKNVGRRIFSKAIEMAGLSGRGFTPYSLRHTSVSLLLSNGASINSVSKRAGHRRASFTLNVYGHALSHEQEIAAAILEKQLY